MQIRGLFFFFSFFLNLTFFIKTITTNCNFILHTYQSSETQRIVQNAIGPSFDQIIVSVHLICGNMYKYKT